MIDKCLKMNSCFCSYFFYLWSSKKLKSIYPINLFNCVNSVWSLHVTSLNFSLWPRKKLHHLFQLLSLTSPFSKHIFLHHFSLLHLQPFFHFISLTNPKSKGMSFTSFLSYHLTKTYYDLTSSIIFLKLFKLYKKLCSCVCFAGNSAFTVCIWEVCSLFKISCTLL
jgi:hypothetical protein